MSRLEVRYEAGDSARKVGELIAVREGIYFQYDGDFRERGIELSPFKLPTSIAAPIQNRDGTYRGLHGVFNDSLPDGWGLLLMDRAMRARGVDPAGVTPVDRLAFLGARTMGALTYHPPAEIEGEPLVVDIGKAAEQADRVLDGSPEDVLPEVLRAGGSPMGARPKIVVGVSKDFRRVVTGTSSLPDGYAHWLIKFTAQNDVADLGAIEMAYASMARAAGIAMPPTRLFKSRDGRRHFGVERFDRGPGDARTHMHTFAGLLHHDYRVPGQDYADLLKLARVLTRNHEDVVAAFRQMVFNVLAHNRDDHTKNFAFLMNARGEWRLSPAYDLIHSDGPGGEHMMTVGGEGRAPTRAHVERVGKVASLEAREIRHVMTEVSSAVGAWDRFARARDVSSKSRRRIQASLDVVQAQFGA